MRRNLRRKDTSEPKEISDDYSPQISVGLPVLIPDTYISDLDVRMNLYHRLGDMKDLAEVESMRAELLDRFGSYPIEVENLLITVELKIMAKEVNIERLEAGPKGANIAFRNNIFPNPAALVAYINKQMGTIRIRPDQKIIVMRPWTTPNERLMGVRNLIKKLAELIK
jgi:transcription-repair coupling factor (superfamily II helicase)